VAALRVNTAFLERRAVEEKVATSLVFQGVEIVRFAANDSQKPDVALVNDDCQPGTAELRPKTNAGKIFVALLQNAG
jgi:hypothetical protein